MKANDLHYPSVFVLMCLLWPPAILLPEALIWLYGITHIIVAIVTLYQDDNWNGDNGTGFGKGQG